MKLLIDTDAFCKLALGGVLDEAIELLGASPSECGRLPALPHMLRRGRLRKLFGSETCDELTPLADTFPVLMQADVAWLEKLTPIGAVDPGEAQLFATAAEHGMLVLSGDKRALRALKDVDDFPRVLAGRIVVLEAILIALCDALGPEEFRRRIRPVGSVDRAVKICISNPDSDPRDGLRSYFENLKAELAPLVLWTPPSRGRA